MREQDDDTEEFTALIPSDDVAFAERHPERPTTGPGVPREVLLARVRAVARWAAPAPAHQRASHPTGVRRHSRTTGRSRRSLRPRMKVENEYPGVRVQLRLGGRDREIVISEDRVEQARGIVHAVLREPFTKRPWRELLFFVISGLLAAVGIAFIVATMAIGLVLFITFIGAVVMAASLRGARGIGHFQRALARDLLAEPIEDPEPFEARPGFFGWLQSALRDRVAWRAVAYSLLKVPLVIFGVWFALSVWIDALFCLTFPVLGSGNSQPKEFGVFFNLFHPGYLSVGPNGVVHAFFIFLTGVLLFFVAPWTMRVVVSVDRTLARLLLSPDPTTTRLRSLEQAAGPNGRCLRRHAAPHRTRPARRDPGAARRHRHAARTSQGEAGRRR